ncbi:MAG: OsmC family protein [Zoogloeaceae bacterium]|nr:OsmC family protein [Rhodocyclaceae bacterium]MCP5234123.1 OsmC family protein [Zoogloeaceae bacterium]
MSITIKRDLGGRMRHQIGIGAHALVADEPPENGGEDSGPTPHDLYDAALGACKALTMTWYAQRKDFPLEDVEVTIERDASAEREGVYRLRALVSLGGELSEDQREALLAVASRCPVHKLMTRVTTEIETVWA